MLIRPTSVFFYFYNTHITFLAVDLLEFKLSEVEIVCTRFAGVKKKKKKKKN